jgi:hypothetical protein
MLSGRVADTTTRVQPLRGLRAGHGGSVSPGVSREGCPEVRILLVRARLKGGIVRWLRRQQNV